MSVPRNRRLDVRPLLARGEEPRSAVEAAIAGVPFREAYKAAAEQADAVGQGRTPESSLAARTSPGAAVDLRLDDLRERLARAS